ncbi:MAG TPA: hypothetical protein VJ865_00685, partial [Gemmatimonadaceae bacterium]|nr:hypothetical protein [Gemmatimonadaceae bacterium]
MSFPKLGSLLVVATLLSFSVIAGAQQPTPEQAQQMLQNNPALLQQLRQKLMSSGLTPDQVRARLRAEGYPENLLDAYLPGATGTPDTTGISPDVFSALTQLGIADTVEVDLLRCGVDADTLTVPDTLPSGLLLDTAQRSRLLLSRRRVAQQRCLAQEDSLLHGLNRPKEDVDSGFVIFGLDF